MADKKIFISYRRADSQAMTDRIYAALVDAFGENAVFRDIHSIPFGVDFRTHIQNAVAECDVMLVVIGDKWLDIKDPEGKRRLDLPTDWMRLEVQIALEREDVPVIPLFVQGVSSLPEGRLPDVLRNLAFRNGVPIRVDPDFSTDIHRLVHNLVENIGFERIFEEESSSISSLTRKELIDSYCRILMGSVETFPLRGIDLGVSDPESTKKQLSIAKVFVDLDTKSHILEDANGNMISSEDQRELLGDQQVVALPIDIKTRPISVIEAIAVEGNMVLLGDPGSGKSACVNYVTYCLAANLIDPEGGWFQKLKGWSAEDSDTIPARVILRDFAAYYSNKLPTRVGARHLWDFINEGLKRDKLEGTAPYIENLLSMGKVIILLDGFDEVATEEQRIFVRDAIQAFQKRYPEARYLVTCRSLSYQSPTTNTGKDYRLENWETYEIAPFDDQKINQFISAWHNELIASKSISPKEKIKLELKLKEAVKREGIHQLATNPLLLTVMAMVHTHKGRLPDARALLYEEVIDILLWRWEQIKIGRDGETIGIRMLLNQAGLSNVDLKRTLWRLAYGTQFQKLMDDTIQGSAYIQEHELLLIMKNLHGESYDWANNLISLMKHRAGILVEILPGIFTFPHRSLQEYMAGAYLAAQTNFAENARKLISNLKVEREFWLETILLAVGRLIHVSGDVEKPLSLIWELCPEFPNKTEKGWYQVWLAGRVLEEIKPSRIDNVRGRELVNRVQERLVSLLNEEALSSVERALAGKSLSLIGDLRFDPETWYLPKDENLGFIEIPEGSFVMGSDPKQDENAEYNELPQHELKLPKFYISKWPVTVAQYLTFVEMSGYKMNDEDVVSSPSNHPVSMISWNDAIAYCKWLTQMMRMQSENLQPVVHLIKNEDWVVTIPSEAQWEKAARGTDGRIYPWGNEFDRNKCNMYDTGIKNICPVGCFPSGASYFGVEELSGNVWELTRSIWIESGYPYPEKGDVLNERENLIDGRAWRVKRGGSVGNHSRFVRCANRDYVNPDRIDTRLGLGFRVVVCPRPSGVE